MKNNELITGFMAGLLVTVALINILGSKKDKKPVDKKQQLKELLAKHVEEENYEEAAKVRDELAAIKEKENTQTTTI